MSESKKNNAQYGPQCTLNYYAQGLLDLEDIIKTTNKMIEARVSSSEFNDVKKSCSVSAVPLKDRMSGMIIKIRLPCHVVPEDILKNMQDPDQ